MKLLQRLLLRPLAAFAVLLAFFTLTMTACAMNDLPRNMRLKAFNPHRAAFTCVHEAAKLPPIADEADRLFQQGLTATSYELWPDDRDYKLAAQLWEQAAALGHWKAAMNLADLYKRGLGVSRDTEQAVLLIEGLMKQGVPAAFDMMGTYHQSGIGVIPDVDRAYGFWQLAADMGNASAQTYIGKRLDAAYNSEQMGVWANRAVARKMLECAFAQGYGDAAYRLGQTLSLGDKNYARALLVYHEGAKFGSRDSARALSVSFGLQRPLTGNLIDRARADRYSTLYEALEHNPDLRFPNLDKVLPLPPADLPFWDGKRNSLIDAAKTVVVKPVVQSTPGADRVGRAHIPEGHVLPRQPVPLQAEVMGTSASVDTPATTRAYFSGYWRPQVRAQQGEDLAVWNSAQLPQRYARGEIFDDFREAMGLFAEDSRQVEWHYAGIPVPPTQPPVHPYVSQGRARYVPGPEAPLSCSGTAPCPQTGIWSARLKEGHPQRAVFYSHWRQAYVERGQAFPVPAALHEAGGLTVQARDLRWYWRGEANRADRSGHVHVTLG